MLQPLQLEDVSARYVEAIVEMRDFLSKVGVSTGRAAALGDVALRLRRDRTFRRDLTSHVWVVMENSDRRISYSDLLGVLAIATAGIHFAADADDYGAHDLLRFLMEARRSLEEAPEVESGFASAQLPAESPILPVYGRQAPPGGPLRARRATEFPPERPQREHRGRVAWMIAAACLLAAVLAGVGLRSRSTSTATSIPSRAEDRVARSAIELPPESASMEPDVAAAAPSRGAIPPASHTLRGAVSRWTAPILREAPRPSPAMATDRTPHNAPIERSPPAVSPAISSSATTLSAPRASTSGLLSAIPSDVLTKRLGSRTLPAVNGDDDSAENPKYPRLHRRRSIVGALLEDETSLVADNQPANAPLPSRRPVAHGAAGVVRPVSLGIMAANVVYSPAPAYPAAASAAHVQGEVKLESQIDRDGNVASTRVISGPPLLRDAALDAVQRWRYRPFLSAGKPTSMSATAIVDFQLP